MKAWYKSKTVWAGVVTAVIGMLTTIGVAGNLASEQDTIANLLTQLGVMVGGIVAVYGRMTAKGRVTTATGTPIPMILICVMLSLFIGGCSRVNLTQDAWADGESLAADLIVVRDQVQAGEYTDEQAAEVMDDVADWLQVLIEDDSGNKLSPRFRQHVITQKNITRRKAQILRGDDVPVGYAARALERTAAMVNLFRRADSGLPSD